MGRRASLAGSHAGAWELFPPPPLFIAMRPEQRDGPTHPTRRVTPGRPGSPGRMAMVLAVPGTLLS
ncbi:hypothetical protein [Desulfomarina sp.]